MARTHPSAEEREARRDELLDAAVDAIRVHGAGVSMEEIAKAAGVTKPILYRHFGHRDGMIATLATRYAGQLQATLQQALDTSGLIEPRTTVSSTIDAYLTFVERDPDVYRFLVARLLTEPASDPAVSLGNFISQVGNQIALVLGEQLRAAGLDSGGAEPLAHGIVGMVHAAGDWWLDRRSMPRARLVEYLTTLLWQGLGGMGLGDPAGATTEGNP
jgi:AcrR family transcriptional regulator